MHSRHLFTALCLLPLLATGALGADEPKAVAGCRFGTQVKFVDTPSEAARLAAKEEKLVFVLHVSGQFDDPRLT
jgi:hypothetical protein